ncbi:tubulin-specific chaperone cofactor E-like protein [Nilaparvata lugens]|uniref:tubulin-specific chaperone cofactor E-like protein n=1 Tax=Nilaparvata lugens TaxID=108931 RepID=UPI00193E7DA6|nr:tubulin-specific chaperone cofactor E-like protein [Nilaparvata lugens]XP_039293554.1 tubulin-specific chaperone cofactor E-like protein [Nilaparvata lugens]
MPSLLEAIECKYGEVEALTGNGPLTADLPVAIYVPKKSPRRCIPSLLVLNDLGIDSAGAGRSEGREVLEDKCQRVEELDLAQNNLNSWAEVMNILTSMPRLKFANLSFNALSECLSHSSLQDFPHLRNLVLNSTNIEWASVRKLLSHLPNLEELHLSKNEMSSVELENPLTDECVKHNNIKSLHFTGNPITHWREICKLGEAFPQLESLVLAHCPLSSLDPCAPIADSSPSSSPNCSPNCSPGGYSRTESECEGSEKRDSPHEPFRQLGFINLNHTLLSSWEDVERLGKFPALHSLRILNCPLFEYPQEYTEHERRWLLVARLPNIQTLNGGGVIGAEEREDAERAFIRYYMDKPESDRPERYTDLVAIHGKLDPLVSIDLRPESRVKVLVTFPQENMAEERQINVYQTVNELKQKLEAFAKIPCAKMRLFYVDQDMKTITGPEEMKYPNKQLYSYNISSGDEIIVSSKFEKTTSLK